MKNRECVFFCERHKLKNIPCYNSSQKYVTLAFLVFLLCFFPKLLLLLKRLDVFCRFFCRFFIVKTFASYSCFYARFVLFLLPFLLQLVFFRVIISIWCCFYSSSQDDVECSAVFLLDVSSCSSTVCCCLFFLFNLILLSRSMNA